MEVIIILKSILLFQGLLYSSYVKSQTTTQSDVTSTSADASCPTGKFFCNDGINCYDPNHKCDGIRDCTDGTDESNCPTISTPCPEQQKRCPDGRCINPNDECPVVYINETTSSSVDIQPSPTLSVTSFQSSNETDSPSMHLATTERQADVTSTPNITETSSFSTGVEISTSFPSIDSSASEYSKVDEPISTSSYIEQETQTYSGEIHSTPATQLDSSSNEFSRIITSDMPLSTEQLKTSPAYSQHVSSIQISPSSTSSVKVQQTTELYSESMQSSTEFVSTDFATTISVPLNKSLELITSMYLSSMNDTSSVSVGSVTSTELYPTVSLVSASTGFISSEVAMNSTQIQGPDSSSVTPPYSPSRTTHSTFSITPSSTLISSSLDATKTITSESITSSYQTSSLTLQPTKTLQINSTILYSSLDIQPSKTVISTESSSMVVSDKFTSPFNRSSTVAPPAEEPLQPWIIAFIVCGSVVFLYLVYMLYVLCTRRHKLTKYKMSYEDPDDIGYRRSIVKRPGHDYVSYDNRLIYEQPDTPDSDIANPFSFRNLTNSDFRNVNE